MLRLEKIFQNDDSFYILYIKILKFIFIFLSIYIFSILINNTVYDIFNYKIFLDSQYFYYSFIVSIFFFIISYFFNERRFFQTNFISFLRDDILSLFFSNLLVFSFFFIFNPNFNLSVNLIYLLIFKVFILSVLKIYFNYFYQKLINDNLIQKNVMLVGNYDEVKKLLKEKLDKIYLIKCCIITNDINPKKKYIKSEIKIPIFDKNDDVRSILEYHALGQIWILNADDKDKHETFKNILRYSVDTINIKLNPALNLKGKKLIADKYDFEYFEWSKFYGINLFVKIIIDKFLSVVFILLSLPIMIIFSILIFIEDGFPIFFSQNRTGWDGRRFKVYKLRSLYNKKYDPTQQVTNDDQRKLKVGKIIRKYSIDEIPQFYNVLRGEMSIVGPRPHPVSLDLNYSNIYESFLNRYRCNPGVTGWAQVNGYRGATINPEFMRKRMELDLWYLNNWSIYLDIYIIFKTFYAVFKYKGD